MMADDHEKYEEISRWRRMRRDGMSIREIAEKVGKKPKRVSAAVYGRIAAHKPEEPPVSHDEVNSSLRGSDSPVSVLTEGAVADMRRRYKTGGVRYVDFAREYGVTKETIRLALKGITWAHVDEPPIGD